MTTTVLLAEDDADHAFFAVRAFREVHGAGVVVFTVSDGEEALEYLTRTGRHPDATRPDLIVLDMKMPRRGGLEVLATIKNTQELHSIPVVMLSSSDRPEDIAQSYHHGANSYVTKPETLDGLSSGVRELAAYWLDVASLPR